MRDFGVGLLTSWLPFFPLMARRILADARDRYRCQESAGTLFVEGLGCPVHTKESHGERKKLPATGKNLKIREELVALMDRERGPEEEEEGQRQNLVLTKAFRSQGPDRTPLAMARCMKVSI